MAMLRAGNVVGVRVNRTGRRTYTRKFKLDVVRQCSLPGVSVSAVALAHGINANLVRRWIVRRRGASPAGSAKPQAIMLPVTIEAASGVSTHTTDHAVDVVTPRSRPGSAVIEIELEGARIHLRGGIDARMLRVVLDSLSQR